MPNNITHKKSTTAGAVPTHAQLTQGELVINAADGKVYTKKTDNTVVDLTDPLVLDGGAQFTPLNISNLALWLDSSDTSTLYTTAAGPVTALNAPTDISGCAMWLDGADAATLFTDTARTTPVTTNGDAIAAWADKSGAGAHATNSTLNQRPIYNVSAINSRSAPLFDGSNDRLVVSAANRPAAANYTLLCVYRVTATPVLGATPVSVKDVASFRSSSSTTGAINWYATNTDITASVGAAFGTATGVIGYTNTNSSVIVYKDGNAVSGTILANPAVSTVAGLHIGSREASLEPFPGHVCEVVYYTRVLTTAERAQLEAYLAAKWGVANVHTPATTSNSPVGMWRDKSGNNLHATQSTAANRPVVGSLNSRAALSFAGANSVTTPDYSAKAISTYFYVSQHNDTADTIFQTGNINSFHSHIIEATHKFRRVETVNQGLVLGANLGSGSPSLWCVDYSNNLISVRYNGATIAQVGSISAGGNISDSTRATTIGRLSPTEAYLSLNGNVAEFIVYGGRHLSVTEKRVVENYLAAKWGITLAPQVSNLDAQNWLTRVYLAGGTVSPGTAAAVNNFCNAIDAAGIRNRFYRLNLFCGDNLTACLVPLYRGPSLTATQLGNATDTNTNFVAADYSERDGLRATATGNETATKVLDCGTNIISALPNSFSGHIAAELKLIPGATMTQQPISQCLADANTPAEPQVTQYRLSMSATSVLEHIVGGVQQVNRTLSAGTRHFAVASRIDQTALSAYLAGTNRLQNAATIPTTRNILSNARLAIFGTTNGSGPPSAVFRHIVSHFSFGLSMTDTQVSAYSAAVATFNAAIGRT